jgi:hypothetical protein
MRERQLGSTELEVQVERAVIGREQQEMARYWREFDDDAIG